MKGTVNEANRQFHKELTSATGLLKDAIQELENAVVPASRQVGRFSLGHRFRGLVLVRPLDREHRGGLFSRGRGGGGAGRRLRAEITDRGLPLS